ncbi:MAG: Xaa-Pro peptidase family protein [Eubacteriales bacterium]|nr:Xaa-Pro peptidase family protein [Eubacteriales bacterium]
MYKDRLDRVCSQLTAQGLTQMIVSDPLSIRYLTGVWIEPYERLYALYLRTDGQHRFFLNNLFVVPDIDIAKTWLSDTDDGIAVIAGLVDAQSDMGIDKSWPARFLLPLMELHPGVRYVNSSACIDRVRAVKDSVERQKMREASLLNDACMEKIAAHIKTGMTELECADYIRSLYKDAGCTESFSTIVSFGANAADPHHEPDDTKLRPGDCVVIDMGCLRDGYCSDMTRTFFCEKADPDYAAIHDLVRRANEKAESLIRPGVRFCDLDKAARDMISEAGYGEYFTHRLGHSIGMQEHEAGDVSQTNTDEVKEGMTFSIEPGVYLPGRFGVRVEDLVLVTKNGCEVLNHIGKHWKIVG